MLFGAGLNRAVIDRKFDEGASFETLPADGTPPPDCDLLFVIDTSGQLQAATESGSPAPHEGDVMVVLGKNASPNSGG